MEFTRKNIFTMVGIVTVVAVFAIAIFVWRAQQSESTGPSPSPKSQTVDKVAPTLAEINADEFKNVGCQLTINPVVSDNRQVERVEYYLDSAQLYITYRAPFSLQQATDKIADGDHTIKVVALDASGNKATRSVSVTIQKTAAGCIATAPPVVAPSPVPATKPGAHNTVAQKTNTGSTTPVSTPSIPPDAQAPTAPSGLFVSFDDDSNLNELTWTSSTDNIAVTEYRIYRDGAQIATSTVARFFDIRIADGQEYDYQIFAMDAAGNASAGSNQVTILLAAQTIWGATAPAQDDSDGTAVEVGFKFQTRTAGKLTGIRFYKSASNTGTHTGSIWECGDNACSTSTLVNSVTFSGETATGWQTAYFTTPVTLTPHVKKYLVSYYAPNGHTSFSPNFFASGYVSSSLWVQESAGAYYASAYKIGAGFPTQNPGFQSAGYGVDLAFAPDLPPAQEVIASKWSDYYNQWSNGPQINSTTYPTAIWQQWAGRTFNSVANGTNFQNLGILYNNGLYGWPGGAPEQIQGVIDTNWPAFASPGTSPGVTWEGVSYATSQPGGNIIKGWLLEDEPDMNKTGIGSALSPQNIEAYGNTVRAYDPTRPTVINFGKGLAIDGWIGYANVETGSAAEDFQTYCRAGDIVSADYYGITDPYESVSYHGPWTYGKMIDNMRKHCGNNKPIWGFVEVSKLWTSGDCNTRIPTPDEMEQAIWSMVIHGANGMNYFTQQFCSAFVEDAVLYNAPMAARVQAVNTKLQTYAQQLNTTTSRYVAAGKSNNSGVPLDTLAKQTGESTYVFAQAGGSASQPSSASVTGTIFVNTATTSAQVLGESRTVPIVNGRIQDAFAAYGVHIYKF